MKNKSALSALIIIGICVVLLVLFCSCKSTTQTSALSGHVGAAQTKVQKIYNEGALPKSPLAAAAIKDLNGAKEEIKHLNIGIAILQDVAKKALEDKETAELDLATEKETRRKYEAQVDEKDKVQNKAIWDRNRTILGLGLALTGSVVWIFRKPIMAIVNIALGVLTKLFGAWR